jgi:hypothetical protein
MRDTLLQIISPYDTVRLLKLQTEGFVINDLWMLLCFDFCYLFIPHFCFVPFYYFETFFLPPHSKQPFSSALHWCHRYPDNKFQFKLTVLGKMQGRCHGRIRSDLNIARKILMFNWYLCWSFSSDAFFVHWPHSSSLLYVEPFFLLS